MNLYHIWFDAKEGVGDLKIPDAVQAYLNPLKDRKLIAGWRLMRRKLGLGPNSIGEWHVAIETEDLAQLDHAFAEVASRTGETEIRHHGLNSLARNLTFALYRDFPDPIRKTGEERF